MLHTSIPNIHGFILAGGEGKRMGGLDKGLVEYNGKPLVSHAINRLAPQVSCLSILANRNLDQYTNLGYTVYPDDEDLRQGLFQGPLAGVLTALRKSTAPYIAIVPCDAPNMPVDLVSRLLSALQNSNHAQIAMPLVLQDDASQWPDPVFMLINRNILKSLEKYFLDGGRKITTWAATSGLCLAPFIAEKDITAFKDIDSLEALVQYANKTI